MESQYVYLVKNECNLYSYKKASNIKMCILYHLLTSDVSCSSIESYLELAYDAEFRGGCGNATCLEKEGGYMSICLEVDVRDEEDDANAEWLKLTIEQYVKILENWRDQVCKAQPSEVIIRYQNEEFIFETKK